MKRRKRAHDGPMEWEQVEGMVVKGTTLEKQLGTGEYNAGCRSVQKVSRSEQQQWVEFAAPSAKKTFQIGFSHLESTEAHERALTHAIICYNGAFTHPSQLIEPLSHWTYKKGDRFKVVVTGDQVSYEHNGKEFASAALKPSFPLFVHAAFKSVGAKATQVKLHTVRGE